MTDSKPDLPVVTHATVWKKPSCPQCFGAIRGLESQGVVPDLRELPEEPEALAAFKGNGFASAPILQFPAVIDGDEVLYKGGTFAGNQVLEIEAFGKAQRELAERLAARESIDEPLLIAA